MVLLLCSMRKSRLDPPTWPPCRPLLSRRTTPFTEQFILVILSNSSRWTGRAKDQYVSSDFRKDSNPARSCCDCCIFFFPCVKYRFWVRVALLGQITKPARDLSCPQKYHCMPITRGTIPASIVNYKSPCSACKTSNGGVGVTNQTDWGPVVYLMVDGGVHAPKVVEQAPARAWLVGIEPPGWLVNFS